MTFPPIDHIDLIALGLPADAPLGMDGATLICGTKVPKFVRTVLRAAMASPPPDGDRMAYLRHVRDLLMGCTDWTQAADSPLSETQRAAWATYRQSLRDLPSVYGGDGLIPWPQEPA
jgi:hypothetical protein